MKKGLLLKDKPEPLWALKCWDCTAVFHTDYDYRQHKKEVHKEIHCWIKYKEEYRYEGETEIHSKIVLTKEWVKIDDNPTHSVPYHDLTGKRPQQRIAYTKEELENRRKKLCHCGKPPTPPRRKYCSQYCTNDWYNKKIYASEHRDQFLSRHSGICEHCGIKARKNHDLEMDHIIAIILGGHPWHEDNMQGLCYDCHKIKTKSDMAILAYWKRECKYDIGFKTIISDTAQQTL